MVLGATLLALLLAAADGGAARDASRGPDAGPTLKQDACEVLESRRPRTIDVPAVEAALARGCAIDAIRAGSQPLLIWSVSDDPKLARWLLAHGASPAVHPPNDSVTALDYVAMDSDQEDVELLDLLVRHGADVNGGPAGGKTPLHFAVEQRHCVEKRGCNCYEEESKLPACEWRSNRRMIRALLAHGADPNRRDESARRPSRPPCGTVRWTTWSSC